MYHLEGLNWYFKQVTANSNSSPPIQPSSVTNPITTQTKPRPEFWSRLLRIVSGQIPEIHAESSTEDQRSKKNRNCCCKRTGCTMRGKTCFLLMPMPRSGGYGLILMSMPFGICKCDDNRDKS
ncbi:hypothetical protein BJ508DRAFT_314129 [Ascobolus immersus RN42]|uniref:Uncharacterized protein n=1 Tax=Ascobolus immersus RN42 TaxID=1160509 RepID=A0A3N4HI68_ASCIM|nr:hypothetical protein BJ508DRAFT_314129 [Ascobolus immersus RN42]